MSTLNVSNISDGTDTVATGYVVNGSAKAFFSNSQTSIDESLNISSIVDSGTGLIQGFYTSAMASANNPLTSGNNNVSSSGAHNYSTGFSSSSTATYYFIGREYANGTAVDMDRVSGATLGELA
jgi:hypothetical protein